MNPNPLAELKVLGEALWLALPPEQAMNDLVVVRPKDELEPIVLQVAKKMRHCAQHDALLAGLWLYIDDLEAAHRLCQTHEGTPTFDYWHTILHRREGDFGNSRYWLRRAAKQELLQDKTQLAEALGLIDGVEAMQGNSWDTANLVLRQRQEWWKLWGSLG